MRLLRVSVSLLLLLALGGVFDCGQAVAAEEVYKLVGEIPIGGEGGWDILTIDDVARRLYLSHAVELP